MKPTLILPLVLLIMAAPQLQASDNGRQAIYDYIATYKDIAIAEMERTGVPASIKMAQAILESNAGRSKLAVNANNHFGIKCAGDWNGRTFYQKDDDRDSRGRLIPSCFRSYQTVEESFIAHSEFLSGPSRQSRYGWLFDLDPTDYEAWAHGLQKSGYATNRRYGNLLINVIENYSLYELDHMERPLASASEREERRERMAEKRKDDGFFRTQGPPPPRRQTSVNRLAAVKANAGETLADIALELEVSLRALLRYNDGVEDAFETFDSERYVFLERKRRNYRGGREVHRVREGEEMFDIANAHGIRLNALHRRNRLDRDREPAVGERIYLRGRRNRNQPVRYRPENYRPPTKEEEIKPESPEEPKPVDLIDAKDIIASADTGVHAEPAAQKSDKDPVGSSANSSRTEQSESSTSIDVRKIGEENSEAEKLRHTVSPGETLFAISRKYDMSVDEVMELNGLTNNQLSIGQVLVVKK